MLDEMLAQLKAKSDQALAAAMELAVTVRGYNVALLGQGFTSKEAFELTRDFQQSVLSGVQQRDQKGHAS